MRHANAGFFFTEARRQQVRQLHALRLTSCECLVENTNAQPKLRVSKINRGRLVNRAGLV